MYDEERPYEVIASKADASVRRGYWDMASGLQAVDGLATSSYANERARRYVAGEISAHDLARDVTAYHEATDDDAREADLVAARITGLLDTSSKARLDLSGRQLCVIHATLFRDVLPPTWVGTYRTEDVAKREPILGGSSVAYAPAVEIAAAVDYDMAAERAHPPYDVHDPSGLDHFVSFVAGLWQTHPFREGNTRTCAVFSQLCLRHMGVDADNEPFRANSVHYRDALVRASVPYPPDAPYDRSFLRAFYDAVVNGVPLDPHVDMNVHGVRDDATPYRELAEYDADVAEDDRGRDPTDD